MAFCSNCGAQLNPGMPFCQNCGAPASSPADNNAGYAASSNQFNAANQPYPTQQYGYNNYNNGGSNAYGGGYSSAPVYQNGQSYASPYAAGYPAPAAKKSSAGKTVGVVAGVVAALGVAALVMWLCGVFKPGYEKALDKFIKAMNKQDAEMLIETLPPFYFDEDEEEYIDQFSYLFDVYEDEYGDDYKITYEITDVEEYSGREIKELEEDIEYWYDVDVDIEEAVTVYIDLSIEGEEDSDEDEGELELYKYDGKWYVDFM